MIEENIKKILIVDDDEDTRTTYASVFSKNGFEVIEANDGIEGLDRATSEEGIDAIFTGIIMPRMDGFQMMEALKKNTVTSNIPVFMNSHLGREDDRGKALALGAKDFIIKGIVSPKDVATKILHELGGIGEKSYVLKIDPFEIDAQKLIQDFSLPDNLVCDNCGTNLAIQLDSRGESYFHAKLLCPNCQKKF